MGQDNQEVRNKHPGEGQTKCIEKACQSTQLFLRQTIACNARYRNAENAWRRRQFAHPLGGSTLRVHPPKLRPIGIPGRREINAAVGQQGYESPARRRARASSRRWPPLSSSASPLERGGAGQTFERIGFGIWLCRGTSRTHGSSLRQCQRLFAPRQHPGARPIGVTSWSA